ncbi:MAG: Rrf2 family transcriptional regulator [Methylotenera sp.]|nr:Rrf2 family transcriptional regulator [Oligoflexia bacterium]
MIKLNRTTEYGLIALRHISRKPKTITSAREVADCYGLPFEITAKTLQKLRDSGLIQSAQGARGGYTLQTDLGQVTLAQFLELMEGPQAVVACSSQSSGQSASPSSGKSESGQELIQITSFTPVKSTTLDSTVSEEKASCGYLGKCEIRGVMNELNLRVLKFLSEISLADLAQSPATGSMIAELQSQKNEMKNSMEPGTAKSQGA